MRRQNFCSRHRCCSVPIVHRAGTLPRKHIKADSSSSCSNREKIYLPGFHATENLALCCLIGREFIIGAWPGGRKGKSGTEPRGISCAESSVESRNRPVTTGNCLPVGYQPLNFFRVPHADARLSIIGLYCKAASLNPAIVPIRCAMVSSEWPTKHPVWIPRRDLGIALQK
jgi:hypothetical protein